MLLKAKIILNENEMSENRNTDIATLKRDEKLKIMNYFVFSKSSAF